MHSTKGWVKSQLFQLSKISRKASPWNAFLRQKLHELNKSELLDIHPKRPSTYNFLNTDRPPGTKLNVAASIRAESGAWKQEFASLSPVQRCSLASDLQAARVERLKTVRNSAKGRQRDVLAAMEKVTQFLTNLSIRTGVEVATFVVRGNIDDVQRPLAFATGRAANFLSNVIKVPPLELAIKMESWVISGIERECQRRYCALT